MKYIIEMLKGWILFLTPCKHEWVEIRVVRRASQTGDPNLISGMIYHQKCNKCGKIRAFEF